MSQKGEIEAALLRIGQKPDKSGFQVLSVAVGLNWETIYKAWLGSSAIGKAAMRQIQSLGVVGERRHERSDVSAYVGRLRWVKVVAMAHAGIATSYEELPTEWQERVPTDAEDPETYGLTIEGDCMEPRYYAGEIAIVMPTTDVRNGDLVVAKLADDGVLFRRYHRLEDGRIRLAAYNPTCGDEVRPLSDFQWIYPVHSTVKRARH